MTNILAMPYVNGIPKPVACSYCGASLEDEKERAATSTVMGTKFFCKAEQGGDPVYSCYNQWRIKIH